MILYIIFTHFLKALKGTRRESLLNETGWSTLKARRNDHKLFMMYKIVNNLAPPYLSELRPDNVSSRSNRSLRANDNLIVPFARTERCKKSFYISSVNLWNSLSATIRSSRSIAIFKNSVTRLHKFVAPNPLYYIGDRLPAILHTRLRLSNSTLNYDLYLKNCVSSSFCACGFPKETTAHFFFDCDRYAVIRNTLVTSAASLLGAAWSGAGKGTRLKWLLCGIGNVSIDTNINLFLSVQKFIIDSGRFTRSSP